LYNCQHAKNEGLKTPIQDFIRLGFFKKDFKLFSLAEDANYLSQLLAINYAGQLFPLP